MSDDTTASKVCRDCGATKDLQEFPPNKSTRDGRGSYCRVCMRSRHRASRDRARGGPPSRVTDTRPLEQRTSKWCPGCRQDKQLVEFGKNRSNTDGRTAYCKPCHNAKGRATYERLYGSTRDYHLRRRYGITSAEFDDLVASQDGVCAVCRARPPKHVDHDHVSGAVRGALCSGCNQGLGNLRDSVEALRAAADYLERTTVQRVTVAPGVVRLSRPVEPRQRPAADLGPLLRRVREAPSNPA